MFEIILTETQLIESLKYSLLNDADPLTGIFRNCKFLIQDIAILNTPNIAKSVLGNNVNIIEPKNLMETKLKGFLEFGGCLIYTPFSTPNPFSYTLDKTQEKIQDVLQYDPENSSTEYSLVNGEQINSYFTEIQVAQKTGHIFIYDPFFIENFEKSIKTITELFNLSPIPKEINVCIVTTQSKRPLSAISSRLSLHFNGNLNVLVVNYDEHDRRSYSDLFSVKPGNGFAFMEKGKYVLSKSSTIDIKYLLNKSNFQTSKKKYEEIMNKVRANYGYRFKYLSTTLQNAANKFTLNNYISYFFK